MKKIFKKARDAAVEIDDTLPEIRDTWCVVRDGVWAYVRTTAIITAGIMALGAVLGLGGMGYALLNNAEAATYDIVADVPAGSARICGRADPVLDLKVPAPADGSSMYEWRERWRVATCGGHNPAVSCPAGLTQWYHMSAGSEGTTHGPTYRDYVCIDLSVPPVPASEPRIRPCYSTDGAPCWGVVEWWQGEWYGTWHPAYLSTPGQCPPTQGVVTKNVSYGHPPGVARVTCAPPGT